MNAPKHVTDRRAANPLNDTVVTITAPALRYHPGTKVDSLEVTVWAVLPDGKIYGHNERFGECQGAQS